MSTGLFILTLVGFFGFFVLGFRLGTYFSSREYQEYKQSQRERIEFMDFWNNSGQD